MKQIFNRESTMDTYPEKPCLNKSGFFAAVIAVVGVMWGMIAFVSYECVGVGAIFYIAIIAASIFFATAIILLILWIMGVTLPYMPLSQRYPRHYQA